MNINIIELSNRDQSEIVMYIPPQCSFAQKKNITKSTHGPNLVDQNQYAVKKLHNWPQTTHQ